MCLTAEGLLDACVAAPREFNPLVPSPIPSVQRRVRGPSETALEPNGPELDF